MNIAKKGAFLLFIVLILAACANSRMAPSSTPTPHPLANLIHTHWTLTAMKDASLPEDMTITLDIDPIRFSGDMGCNDYFFDYEVQPNGQWQFVSQARTAMKCPETGKAEANYLNLLGRTHRYKVLGDTLILKDAAGQTLLTFSRQPTFTPHPELLMNRVWQLEKAQGVHFLNTSAFTVRFDNQSMQITTSCSKLSGVYQMKNERIRITGMRTEDVNQTCDENARESERQFLNLLSQTVLYRIANDQLSFYSPRGEELLTFVPDS